MCAITYNFITGRYSAQGMPDSSYLTIAKTLKQLRAERGWSLSECAQKTATSKAMLGQIERGESSPTLKTLWRIATGLDVPLSALLSLPAENVPSFSVPGDEESQIKIHQVLPYSPMTEQEVYVLSLKPGAITHSDAHAVGTLETLYVMAGALELFDGTQWQTFEAGQGHAFQADTNHAYRNSGLIEVVFHTIIRYQKSERG